LASDLTMTNSKAAFYPQLDSLRAIAVLLVIVSHWFTQEHFFNRYTANGVLGVTLFFVLSGFLITGILLNSKKKTEQGGSVAGAFKVFYIRRSLRIFPVYYLLLLILVLFNIAAIRESFWWHFFYGSNFYFWIKGSFEGQVSHFWSLAVEEQFYLVWPAVILFTPRRFLALALVAGIAAGMFFRLVMVTPENDLGRLLMPGSLDSFCIGGLLAYGRTTGARWYNQYLQRQTLFVLFAVLLLALVHVPAFRQLPAAVYSMLYLVLISIAFGILINRVANTVETPVLKQILDNKLLLYIGKISYGVYLFHNFIPYFYGLKIPGMPAFLSMYLVQGVRFVVLIAVASFSWFLVEKPILQLKKRFEYI
jgi:peptidoglycan/LPS O-acetylase OafA/YrhL